MLSTNRLVLINTKNDSSFKGFEIPLVYINKE